MPKSCFWSVFIWWFQCQTQLSRPSPTTLSLFYSPASQAMGNHCIFRYLLRRFTFETTERGLGPPEPGKHTNWNNIDNNNNNGSSVYPTQFPSPPHTSLREMFSRKFGKNCTSGWFRPGPWATFLSAERRTAIELNCNWIEFSWVSCWNISTFSLTMAGWGESWDGKYEQWMAKILIDQSIQSSIIWVIQCDCILNIGLGIHSTLWLPLDHLFL